MSKTAPLIKLNDGTLCPAIGFGTGTALYGQDCAASVTQAINAGFTHLDGAQVYNNEEHLGAGIKAAMAEKSLARDDLYIVTKLKPKVNDVEGALVESLRKLEVDYVNLYLIHAPPRPFDRDALRNLWTAMEVVKSKGLARSIGVSNFTVKDLEAILTPDAEAGFEPKVVPSVNQIEFHPYVWKEAEPIVEFCLQKGIKPESYGGLVPLQRVTGGHVEKVLPAIAERYKNSGIHIEPAQILEKWILQKGAIVVTTSSKKKRLEEYLAVPELPDLTAEEIQSIEGKEESSTLHKRVYMANIFEF
ncbi:NADP-dependent oxidoreductase domain-containing protein [Roridomyces roridus]|uniref:NADP-dependent oxidoreductase domain-containing protein n=1 Tax=Roridomyces roridus TaxID=1738132 RepID=A0AAD7FQ37_9AGAR|nr:NADP-dependent oxidoreductase domain-containing protein [Roridomyces roridus]